MWKEINVESRMLLKLCKDKKLTISTAESCTGGLVASSIIHNQGSSHVFQQGYITYSNKSKHKELNIPIKALNQYGAVSKEISQFMLTGLLVKTKSSIGVSVTGIAGPGGSSKDKPVGLVWITYGNRTEMVSKKFIFNGNRLEIRLKTTLNSLILLNKILK